MESRKTDKAGLEKKRVVFFTVGLLCIISICYIGFSFKSYDKASYDFKLEVEDNTEEMPPLKTAAPPPPPPPPPPKKVQEPELEITEEEVEDDKEEFEDEEDEEEGIEDTGVGEEEEEAEDIPVMFVSEMPFYPECKDAGNNMQRNMCTQRIIRKFLTENYKVSDIVREMDIKGTVYVSFVVNKKGKVGNIEILKSDNKQLNKAAIDVVKKLPVLVPGKDLDKPKSVKYQVPIKVN